MELKLLFLFLFFSDETGATLEASTDLVGNFAAAAAAAAAASYSYNLPGNYYDLGEKCL